MTKNCLHNPIAIGVRLSMARKENDRIAAKPQLIFHGRVVKDRTLRRKGILTPLRESHPEVYKQERSKTPPGMQVGRQSEPLGNNQEFASTH